MSRCIAIVGAGFSGTVLAANLLRQPPSDSTTDIVLIERGTAMGPGVAYATRDWPYLLNVPAGRLSADSRDSQQFLRFARETIPAADAEDFLPRSLYGDYLQRVLQLAEHDATPGMRLVRVFAEVTGISRSEANGALELTLKGRAPLCADRVVLAVGNASPSALPWERAIADHPAYRRDPWSLPRSLSPEHTVVIVGNGLTMVDVALSLGGNAGRTPRLVSISRRGLLPQPQSAFRPGAHEHASAPLTQAKSLCQLIAISRRLADDYAKSGRDWREVVTVMRNLAPQLWQGLSDADRRRFLRHAQGFWDVHRHRLPPQMSTRLDSLRSDGHLEVNAGRIVAMQAVGERLRVSWKPRGTDSLRNLVADLVINATGPNYALKHSTEPLVNSLRESGMISEDNLDLGLRTDSKGACIGNAGTAHDRLYYLGPMLRASYWEATAATELRDHAETLARHLAALRGIGAAT